MPAPSPTNSVLQPPMITQRREREKHAEGPELCGERLGVWTLMALLLGLGSSKVSGNSVYMCVAGAVTEEYCLQDNDLCPHHPPPAITYTRPDQASHPETPPPGSCSCSFRPQPTRPLQG